MKRLLGFLKKYFGDFGTAVKNGNVFTKLSLLILGAGYFGVGQIIKGVLITAIQVGIIAFVAVYCAPYLAKFGSLGTVQREVTLDPLTFAKTVNKYDNSMLILFRAMILLSGRLNTFPLPT